MNADLVMILAPEPLLALGLKKILLTEGGFARCLEASHAVQAVEMQRLHRPRLIVLEAVEADGSVPRLVKDLRRGCGETRILVLGRSRDQGYARRVLEAGARGYMLVADSLSALRLAILSVLEGNLHVSAEASAGLWSLAAVQKPKDQRAQARLGSLSDREMDVFRLVGQSLGTKEIAHQLHISVKTVETHKQRMKEKLGLECAGDLRRLAGGRV